MPEQHTLFSKQTQHIQNNDVQKSIVKEVATLNNINQNEVKQNNDVIIGGTYHSLNDDDNYPNLICINYDKAIKEVTLVGFDIDDVDYKSKFLTLPVLQDRQLLEKCNAEASLTESRYIAYLPDVSNFSTSGQAFDATDANEIIKDGQIIGLDFDRNGQQDYLTTCSSMEGEHLNAWQDKTRSKKLAYAYRYIDADLITTCEEIDYDNSYL
ncbi:hypothetical protein [Psychrobacter sp. AOP7-B1-24]|uniref:hypothetical protein n=1 Tax=Psychrobacter sp. AOP7-B1-24 TaxID=3457645 RepID=UPI00402B86B5